MPDPMHRCSSCGEPYVGGHWCKPLIANLDKKRSAFDGRISVKDTDMLLKVAMAGVDELQHLRRELPALRAAYREARAVIGLWRQHATNPDTFDDPLPSDLLSRIDAVIEGGES